MKLLCPPLENTVHGLRGNCGIIKRYGNALRDASTSEGSKLKGLAHMPDYIMLTCPVCGKEYPADPQRLKWNRQTTCSRKCSYKYRAAKQSVGQIEVTCLQCGKITTQKPYEKNGKKFCSLACYHAYRNPDNFPLDKICPICGTQFRHRGHKYCGRNCFEVAHKERMSGAGNPSYLDGRSLNATYDAGTEWAVIRSMIYERDHYTCQQCGAKCVGKRDATSETSHLIIQCHHVNPYKKSKNNDLSNLVTLCLRCHRHIHNDMKGFKRAVTA